MEKLPRPQNLGSKAQKHQGIKKLMCTAELSSP